MTTPSMAEDSAPVSNEPAKVCTKCGEEKSAALFSKSKIHKSGRYPSCKECRKTQGKDYYARNHVRILARMKVKNETRRDKMHAYHAEWYERNKVKKLARNQAWKAANADYYRSQQKDYIETYRQTANENSRRWAKLNPDRRKATQRHANTARRLSYVSGCTKSELGQWVNCQPKVCTYCAAGCEQNYHVDHFYPLSRGGRHEIGNLRIACKSCNLRKSARDPHEFIASLSR